MAFITIKITVFRLFSVRFMKPDSHKILIELDIVCDRIDFPLSVKMYAIVETLYITSFLSWCNIVHIFV